jgi:hypothetical protein
MTRAQICRTTHPPRPGAQPHAGGERPGGLRRVWLAGLSAATGGAGGAVGGGAGETGKPPARPHAGGARRVMHWRCLPTRQADAF